MLALAIITGFLCTTIALNVVVLWFVARRLKVSRPTLPFVIAAMAALLVLGAVISIAIGAGATVVVTDNATAVAYLAFAILAQVLVCSLSLKLIFGTTLLRGTLLWLASSAVAIVALPILMFLIRPYVFESFVSESSNAMAPTIVGWHANVACPHCGAPAVVPLQRPSQQPWRQRNDDEVDRDYSRILCGHCWKSGEFEQQEFAYAQPDRFSVDKLATPRRWDVVVFRAYADNDLHVFRLVGMPGETIEIKEGAIYANGQKLVPPAGVGIQYELPGDPRISELPEFRTSWQLGDQEVILLGDNSRFSNDSRFQGPIPRADIVGVVRWRYWPPNRVGAVR
jgi:signal peptidase I